MKRIASIGLFLQKKDKGSVILAKEIVSAFQKTGIKPSMLSDDAAGPCLSGDSGKEVQFEGKR